jgi:hypothetical protein
MVIRAAEHHDGCKRFVYFLAGGDGGPRDKGDSFKSLNNNNATSTALHMNRPC